MKIEPFNCKRCGVYVSAAFIKNKHVRNRKKAWREGLCFKRCSGTQKDLGGYPLDPVLRKEYLKEVKQKRAKRKKKQERHEKPFYESRQWLLLRYQALKLYGKQCQLCGATPPDIVIHVDHIKPRSKYPELELELNNLQILCEPCNLGKSNIDETDWRPVETRPSQDEINEFKLLAAEIKALEKPKATNSGTPMMPKKGILDLPDF